MLLNRQRTLLTIVAALAFAATLAITALAAREVRSKTEQIGMAQDTVRAITNFRYLTMEVALYGEARAQKQWERRHAGFTEALAGHRYSGAAETRLLERERHNLAMLARLFRSITPASEGITEAARRKNAALVSSVFLTTQDMLDDAFELMRLNRISLEAAQRFATISAMASLALMVLLIAFASMVIRQRVLRPVAALQRLTEQVIEGHLDVRLNLAERNEIGMLARSFDAMTEKLQQSDQELRQAQQALQQFIDFTPALVVYWDRDLRNRFANRAYQQWFGKAPEAIRGLHISDIIGAERFREIEARLRSALAGNPEIFERRLTIHTGEVRDALFSYLPDLQDGQVRGIYGLVSDITSLKRAEAGQEMALQQLQGVVDAASDFAIIQFGLDGRIALFSKGAENLLGYEAHELLGQATPAQWHVAEELAWRAAVLSRKFGRPVAGLEALTAALEAGSESLDWTYVRKDGSQLAVNLTMTAMRARDGAVVGYLGVAKDIHAEREVRRVLADARDQAEQANLAKSQFLANMSHEIRTPMNAVLGMLELLQHTELTALQREYAGKSDMAARSLLGLLNDILDFSQVEAGKLELERAPFRIDQLMEGLSAILSSLLGDKDVELIFDLSPALPETVLGDAKRLRQVLINLAGNAIKFTTHGAITLSLAPDGEDRIAFAVQDTGIGIPADKLERIFDSFTQAEASTARRFGGTGLGLTISQRLVALMGGTLSVTSVPGQGSRFAFAAPLARAHMLGEGAGAAVAPPALKVLVVDDHALARRSLMAMAAGLGWQALDAASGEEALAVLEAADNFDLVLADWRMPYMDGWELARRIRAEHATPVVVMVTARGRGALAELPPQQRALIKGFLTKPVTPAMLAQAATAARAAPADIAPSVPASGPGPLAGLAVLVVDDNPMNQQIAHGLLTHADAAVTVAGGGEEALALAAVHTFHAVLMDIQMPDMDGYQCTRALRRLDAFRSIPIIAMTANVLASDRAACIAAGMDDHVGKPIDIAILSSVLLRHCRPAAAPAPAAAPLAPLLAPGGTAIEYEQALARLGGNRDLFVALADTYVLEARQFLEQLAPALAAPGYEGAPNLLHTFKSAAGIVGAAELQHYTAALEGMLRKGEPVNQGATLAALELLVEASIAELAVALAD